MTRSAVRRKSKTISLTSSQKGANATDPISTTSGIPNIQNKWKILLTTPTNRDILFPTKMQGRTPSLLQTNGNRSSSPCRLSASRRVEWALCSKPSQKSRSRGKLEWNMMLVSPSRDSEMAPNYHPATLVRLTLRVNLRCRLKHRHSHSSSQERFNQQSLKSLMSRWKRSENERILC